MRIIGQFTPATGEHRKRDLVLDAARRRARQANRKVVSSVGSPLTGAHDAVAIAVASVQRSFARVPNATVTIGKPSKEFYDHTHKV
jgi:hypothetical protein